MPFVTEEIYSKLIPEEESLMMSDWPEAKKEWEFPQAENVVEHLKTHRQRCEKYPGGDECPGKQESQDLCGKAKDKELIAGLKS